MMRAPMAVADSTAPAPSKRPSDSVRSPGMARRARNTPTIPSGTLMANSHSQLEIDSRTPPSDGPTAVNAATINAFTPRIRPSSRFGKIVRRMAGPMLRMADAPSPCSRRMPISTLSDGASAHPSDASVNTARPAANWLR